MIIEPDPQAQGDPEAGWGVAPLAPADMGEAIEAPANVPLAPGLGFSVDTAELPLEGWQDSLRGTGQWRTLICADRTPSSGLVMGVAEFGPGETLEPHRHAPAEVYLGLGGAGIVEIEGEVHEIREGVAVYIPPGARHATRAGPCGLRFAYCFPTARFAEVDYRFSSP